MAQKTAGALSVGTTPAVAFGPTLRWVSGTITNLGSNTVYLKWTNEDAVVSTTNGIPLAAGATIKVERKFLGPVSGFSAIAATGTNDVRYSFA
jgi:hypothetical protein